jgi:hypothetical protein
MEFPFRGSTTIPLAGSTGLQIIHPGLSINNDRLITNAPESSINSGAFWELFYASQRIHIAVLGVITSYQSPVIGSRPPPAGP